jgi:predicted transcriptional regulator
MNANRPKRTSERIYPRVAPTLAQRLAKHAAASSISETAVVEAALEQYLDGVPTDTALIMARLDRLGRAHERSQRDQMLHAEAFVAYVNIWFASTPTLPEGAARDKAVASADERLKRFLVYVAQQVSRGGYLEQMPRERIADDKELSATEAAPPATNPPAGKAG